MKYFVLYFPQEESGPFSYMYAHSEDERDTLVADGALDVTGNRDHEFQAVEQLGPFDPDQNMDAERKLRGIGGAAQDE